VRPRRIPAVESAAFLRTVLRTRHPSSRACCLRMGWKGANFSGRARRGARQHSAVPIAGADCRNHPRSRSHERNPFFIDAATTVHSGNAYSYYDKPARISTRSPGRRLRRPALSHKDRVVRFTRQADTPQPAAWSASLLYRGSASCFPPSVLGRQAAGGLHRCGPPPVVRAVPRYVKGLGELLQYGEAALVVIGESRREERARRAQRALKSLFGGSTRTGRLHAGASLTLKSARVYLLALIGAVGWLAIRITSHTPRQLACVSFASRRARTVDRPRAGRF